jgi:hypothetical protein
VRHASSFFEKKIPGFAFFAETQVSGVKQREIFRFWVISGMSR